MHAVVGNNAVLELSAKRLEELLVVLAAVVEHGGQLVLDLLLEVLGDREQVTVMLQHLARNVEREIGGVDDTLYKAEVLGHELLAVVCNENAA